MQKKCEMFEPREEMYCMVLEVQLQSVKCTAVTRIRKISSIIFSHLGNVNDYSVQMKTNHLKKVKRV